MELDDIINMKSRELDKLLRKNFQINLERILHNKKMSHSELAKKIGISNTSRWAYQTENTFPSTGTLLKMAIVLNVSINDLLLPKDINNSREVTEDFNQLINSKLDLILFIVKKLQERD